MGIFLGILFAIFVLVAIAKLLKASKISQDVRNNIEFFIIGYKKAREETARDVCKFLGDDILKKQLNEIQIEFNSIDRNKFAKAVNTVLPHVMSAFHKDDVAFYVISILMHYRLKMGDDCFRLAIPLNIQLLDKITFEFIDKYSLK